MAKHAIYSTQFWRDLPRDESDLVENRFLAKVDVTDDGCWSWSQDNGLFWVGGKNYQAKRWAYEHFVGHVPDNICFYMDCQQEDCVNPTHMDLVTLKRIRELRGLVTHCSHGHPYDNENTYVSPQGLRYCRTCRREFARKRGSRPTGWSAIRKRVLEHYDYKCAVGVLFGLEDQCHKILDVHHRVPRRLGGTDDLSNLYVLCRSHHGKVEAVLRRAERGEDPFPIKETWTRCPHTHRTRESREACERRLNRDLVLA